MKAQEFYKQITMDRTNLLDRLLGVLEEHSIPYCVIGGQAVNAYVEPLVSLDLDLVVAVGTMDSVRQLLKDPYRMEEFQHGLNVSLPGSDLRVQFQTDPRYYDFVDRSTRRDVLGLQMPVASLPEVLQGKIWAATDHTPRPSKRRKDLLDIERLVEAFPELGPMVPVEIRQHLDM
jgi:hypothetical protein